MTPKRVMEETTRQRMLSGARQGLSEAPLSFEPLGYFCHRRDSVLDCAHVWKLERERAKWRQTNATPSQLPPLTGAFAHGWNKLPAELKLRIFSFVTGSALAAPPCSHYHKQPLQMYDMKSISRRIIQFARCTPEFKVLAEQTIYSEHQFAIANYDLRVSMPPSKYVRLLTINLNLYDGVHGVHHARRILEILRDNLSAFQVKQLIVVINSHRLPIGSDVEELLSQRFELCARSGWVRVVHTCVSNLLLSCPETTSVGRQLRQYLAHFEEIQKLATKNITFSPARLDAKKLIKIDQDAGEDKVNDVHHFGNDFSTSMSMNT